MSSFVARDLVVVVIQQRDQRIWWLYGRKLLIVYLHSVKIDSHRHYINGYIIILVCHAILQHHAIYGRMTYYFMGRSHSR